MKQAEIKTKLTADGSELTRALRQGVDQASSFRNQMSGIGKSIGAAFTVTAIAGFARSLATLGDDIQDAAGALELSTDELQAFDAAARKTAGGVDGFRAGIKKLAEVQADAREKGGSAAESFDKLGLGVKGYTMSLAEVTKAAADYYARTGDLATVQDLFGRSAVTTREALTEISQKSLPEFIEAMKDSGLVIDTEGIKKLAEFNLMLEESKIKAASFAVDVAGLLSKVDWKKFGVTAFMGPAGPIINAMSDSKTNEEAAAQVTAAKSVAAAMTDLSESLDVVSEGAAEFAVEQLRATELERAANVAREENADIFKFLMALGDSPSALAQDRPEQRFSDLRRIGANELGRGVPNQIADKQTQQVDLLKAIKTATEKTPEAVKQILSAIGVFTT
jgi:hypothetical protein